MRYGGQKQFAEVKICILIKCIIILDIFNTSNLNIFSSINLLYIFFSTL